MTDLIDRETVRLAYEKSLENDNHKIEGASAIHMQEHRHILHILDKIPTIDPESLRPQGHWIGEADGYADGELVYDVWYCSECNHCIDDGTDNPDLLPNYCPNCGAYMKGAGENADS